VHERSIEIILKVNVNKLKVKGEFEEKTGMTINANIKTVKEQ